MEARATRRKDVRTLGRGLDVPLALVVAILYAFATFAQEKFTACNGFGHDGCAYGNWALDFPKYAFENRLGSYGIQRALPSLVAWASLKLLHIPPTPAAVVRAFQIMNIAAIFTGALAWTKIARILQIRAHAMLFGTLAMFGSYGIVKFTTWYPVLGDLWGFALGFAFLYAYLARRAWLIAPGLVIGAFAWPSLMAPGLLLLFFGRHAGKSDSGPRRARSYIAGSLALAWGLFTLQTLSQEYWPPSLVTVDTLPQVVRLSVLIAVAYCFFASRELLSFGAFYRPALYLRAALSPEGVLAIAVLIAVKYAQFKWSVPQSMGFRQWIRDTAVLTTLKPGIFMLAYVVYFGPLVLIAILRWRRLVEHMRPYGAGVLGVGMLAVLFGLDSEERHGYTFLAVVLPFALKVVDELNLDRQTYGRLAFLTVMFSKFWLTLPADLPGAAADFPAQTVFMSQGPWMSNLMYLIQMPLVVSVGIWLHGVMKRSEAAFVRQPSLEPANG